MKLISTLLMSTFSMALATNSLADTANWAPPPGEYRIDTTTTKRWNTPTGMMESVEQVDGATGSSTLTQRAPGVSKPVVTTAPGAGPVRYCQAAAAAPTAPANGCVGKLTAQGDAASTQVQCAGQTQNLEFRKISAGVWEKRIAVQTAATPQPNLPPQAQAAVAQMIAQMQARMQAAPPAEADALRQQIAALQRGGSQNANTPTVESVQRWTLLSNHCSTRP